MEFNLIAFLLNLVINIIVVSPVLWLAGRALVGKEKTRFSDSVARALLHLRIIIKMNNLSVNPVYRNKIGILIIFQGKNKKLIEVAGLET